MGYLIGFVIYVFLFYRVSVALIGWGKSSPSHSHGNHWDDDWENNQFHDHQSALFQEQQNQSYFDDMNSHFMDGMNSSQDDFFHQQMDFQDNLNDFHNDFFNDPFNW